MRRTATSLLCALGCAATLGCSNPATGPDAARPPDMRVPIVWKPDMTGKWVGEMTLDLDLGGAGDAGASAVRGLKVLVSWTSLQSLDKSVQTQWELCTFPLPGLGIVSDDVLGQHLITTTNGKMDTSSGEAHFVQPTVNVIAGAQLASPGDPLPTDTSKVCADATSTGCVTVDAVTMKPGFAIPVNDPTIPDIDTVYVDLRAGFSLDGVLVEVGALAGKVPMVSFESHVLACHLRTGMGSDCTPSDIARVEALHPIVMGGKGALRWRGTGIYVTCPAFEMDPEAYLGGVEPLDGGVLDMKGTGGMSFPVVQDDLDARGCATGGCHEATTRPGAMHLVFRPKTAELLRQNYEAVLPFTKGPLPGGQLANQVPIPGAMQQRWIDWVAAGSPF